MVSRRALLALGLASLGAASCQQILGIEDRTLITTPTDGGADAGPVVLADKLNDPYRLLVDTKGENLYWTNFGSKLGTNDGTVESCKVTGCGGKPSTLASGIINPTEATLDDEAIYWVTTAGTLLSCALGGCKNTPSILWQSKTEFAISVAVDATSVYWVQSDATIHKASKKDGKGDTVLASTTDGLIGPRLVFVDGTDLFIADVGSSTGSSSAPDSFVGRMATSGGTLHVLATDAGCPCWIQADAKNVYWTSFFNDGIAKVARDKTGSPVDGTNVYVSNLPGPIDLFLDTTASMLYAPNVGFAGSAKPDGTLIRVPAAGGNVGTVDDSLHDPVGVRVAGPTAFLILAGDYKGSNVVPLTGSLLAVPK